MVNSQAFLIERICGGHRFATPFSVPWKTVWQESFLVLFQEMGNWNHCLAEGWQRSTRVSTHTSSLGYKTLSGNEYRVDVSKIMHHMFYCDCVMYRCVASSSFLIYFWRVKTVSPVSSIAKPDLSRLKIKRLTIAQCPRWNESRLLGRPRNHVQQPQAQRDGEQK